MTALSVCGLDLALGRTGWAVVGYEHGDLLASGVIAPDVSLPLVDRLHAISSEVRRIVDDTVGNVFVEAPISYRSGTTTIRIGMVHGAVLDALHAGPPVNAVNVTELKRWATGKGNADKEAMVAAAAQRFGVVLTHDAADAALVAAWGRHQIERAMSDHPTGAA